VNAQTITIDKLRPSQLNPRQSFGDLGELEASIRAQGVIEPVIVAPDGNGGYEVIAGGRRVAAAKKAGLKEVPAIVREDLDERARAELALIENLQRLDLSPLEEAHAYQRLLELAGEKGSQRQIAERIGVSQGHVSKRLALLELPTEAKRALDAGGITVADAVELTKLKDRPKAVKRIVKESGAGYQAVDRLVERELQEAKRAEERGAKLQALKAKGVTILKDRPGYGKGQPRQVDSYDMAHVDARKHAKEPCHAVYVDEWGEVQKYCTEPKNHPKPKEKKPPETKAERQERERMEELDRVVGRRREFIGRLVTGRIPKAAVTELLATMVLGGVREEVFFDYDHADLAGEFLAGKAPEAEEEQSTLDTDTSLDHWLAEHPDDVLRAAFAVAMAIGEDAFGRMYAYGTALERHFAFLRAHGYRTSPAEREQLEAAKARG
jgi:ParB family chromosome partitioning protein